MPANSFSPTSTKNPLSMETVYLAPDKDGAKKGDDVLSAGVMVYVLPSLLATAMLSAVNSIDEVPSSAVIRTIVSFPLPERETGSSNVITRLSTSPPTFSSSPAGLVETIPGATVSFNVNW